ncbi:sulfite exporter TauE/SafE family protein [Cognatiyoonia sp. IB215182]|uniref:sulfite exporter TauE/SafE family protein n=1 Tax=Cognatiyoonia sp. IB215182 TaxID=3097353 RepID=UPI002A152569|nr:sulfite exporter TauE/SafE family protein [Cognatiyoonia sp. IB215182]MDX8351770.1 sulfite exporter TauE/SafE family protein [Cognatiyoonia sp. IB215182]
MVEFGWEFFAVGIPAIVFGGISKAGFGSGAAFAAGAILALVVPPGLALGIVLPLFMLVDAATLRPYWGKWHWPSAKGLMIGAVPGCIIAAWLYTAVEADVFRLLIGVICLAFVAFQLSRALGWLQVRVMPFSRPVAWFAGLVSGFTSFVSHAGGPPAAVFLLSQGLSKTAYQATTVVVFWAVNWMKAVPYAFLGIFSWESLMGSLVLTPFALLGTWLGLKAHHIVSERVFFGLTYVLLIITGLRLIWVAMS